jgi:hypothetical protein
VAKPAAVEGTTGNDQENSSDEDEEAADSGFCAFYCQIWGWQCNIAGNCHIRISINEVIVEALKPDGLKINAQHLRGLLWCFIPVLPGEMANPSHPRRG